MIKIEDVTDLAHEVHEAHMAKPNNMEQIIPKLPLERPYMPHCEDSDLSELGLMPGETADKIAYLL